MDYRKAEAKDWAREHMRGVCNVILPTFTADFHQLNEPAIRFDVERNIALGFWGALVVSECGTTMEEYRRFLEIVADQARGRLRVVVHGSFNTVQETLDACRFGEAVGADALLLTYPPTFYPESEQDIYDYTATVLDGTHLASVLFAVHQWNFEHIHPATLSTPLIRRLADFPNAVAMKCEGGGPGNGAIAEIVAAVGDRILVSDPREYNSPGWVQWFGMQWMGTSNFECYGDIVPRYFQMLHEGRQAEAMELYWQIQPVRLARKADMDSYAGANIIHRFSWKYQAWLNGFNGGPLRLPVMRLRNGAVRRLYDAAVRSGLIAAGTPGDLAAFYRGRNPA